MQEIAAETVSSWKTVRRHIAYQKIPLRPQDSLLSRKNTIFGTVIIDGNSAVNDLETKAISYIKLLRNEGKTYRQIVAKLNKENIPARKSGARWHLKTVFKVLEKSD